MLLYWHSIWVIAIFSCSYALFFVPVKMNFSTFHIVHCCCQCHWCCDCSVCGCYSLNATAPPVWDFNVSLVLYLSTYLCAVGQLHIQHIRIITFYLNFYFTLFDFISFGILQSLLCLQVYFPNILFAGFGPRQDQQKFILSKRKVQNLFILIYFAGHLGIAWV